LHRRSVRSLLYVTEGGTPAREQQPGVPASANYSIYRAPISDDGNTSNSAEARDVLRERVSDEYMSSIVGTVFSLDHTFKSVKRVKQRGDFPLSYVLRPAEEEVLLFILHSEIYNNKQGLHVRFAKGDATKRPPKLFDWAAVTQYFSAYCNEAPKPPAPLIRSASEKVLHTRHSNLKQGGAKPFKENVDRWAALQKAIVDLPKDVGLIHAPTPLSWLSML
jgi:hypothetical protein